MKRRVAITVVGMVVAAAVWAHWPHSALPVDARADRVVVRKAERALSLYHGSDLMRTYTVALGPEPVGPKERQGDGRTPEGDYVLDYRKPDSSFHRALHISYPSRSDLVAAQSVGADPGGLIMVHGLKNGLGFVGRLHTLFDWTDGCIGVTDTEIEEISRVVADGIPIRIEP